MHCYNCGVYCEMSDNYCRKCGAPVRSGSIMSIVPAAAKLPVTWNNVRSNVVRGAVTLTAAVALEIVTQLLARRTRSASPITRWLPGPRGKSASLPDQLRDALAGDGSAQEYVVTEAFGFKETRVRR